MQDESEKKETEAVRREELLRTAEEWLLTWPKLSAKDKLKRGIRQYLLRQKVAPLDHWFWPHAMLAEGLLANGRTEAVQSYFDRWIANGIPLYYVDNAANGIPLLDLYEITKNEKYLKTAEKTASYLKKHPQDACGNLIYRRQHPEDVYADTLGMVCPFLCRYGAMTQDAELVELGMRQLLNFLENGMDARSGLCYHGFRMLGALRNTERKANDQDSCCGPGPKDVEKQGIIGWGRAMGWLLKGLVGSLPYLPKQDERTQKLQQASERLISICMEYQREDGSFAWMLSAMEGPADLSATAMIGCEILKCQWEKSENGDLKTEMTELCEKREDALKKICKFCSSSKSVTQCSAECEGFAQYPQRYGSYPWGLGSMLLLLGMCAEQNIEKAEKTI